MKFKDKRLRTTHKCCKTCCFKAKIRCGIESYGFRDEDGEGICVNYVSVDWWRDEEWDWRKYTNNYKRLHRKEVDQRIMQRIHNDIEHEKYLIENWRTKC